MWPFNKKKKTVAAAKVPTPNKRINYGGYLGSVSSPRIHSESRRDDTADILLTGMVINSMMNDDSHSHSHRHDTDYGNGFSGGGGGSFDGGGSSGSWDSGSSDSGSSYDSGSSDSSSSSSD